MTARTVAASGILTRGGALIVALGLVTLASEKTPTLAASNQITGTLAYKILNLRTPNPWYFCPEADCESHASDVNILGQVTGWSRLGPHDIADPFIRAFRTAPNATIDINSFPSLLKCPSPFFCGSYFLSWRSSFGHAINDSGWIVGTECVYDHAGVICAEPTLAFVAPGAQALHLHVLLEEDNSTWHPRSSAHAINNLGTIVGASPEGGWIGNTGALLPSSIASPEDINDHGVVVGRTTSNRAFRWLTGSTGVEDLGALDSTCTTCTSIAHAINDAGRIVGASQKFAALPGVSRAFIWRRRSLLLPGGQMTDLGTLCLGTQSLLCSSEALNINNHGHVVGTSDIFASSNSSPHAFLYKASEMADINTLISPADRAVWKLVDATAINDLGQIVGTGLFDTTSRAPTCSPRRCLRSLPI